MQCECECEWQCECECEYEGQYLQLNVVRIAAHKSGVEIPRYCVALTSRLVVSLRGMDIPLLLSEPMHHVAVVCMSVPPQVSKPKTFFADIGCVAILVCVGHLLLAHKRRYLLTHVFISAHFCF